MANIAVARIKREFKEVVKSEEVSWFVIGLIHSCHDVTRLLGGSQHGYDHLNYKHR